MASEEEKLRDEIIEFQKARADILRWKLIAIGGVGAAGLSLSASSGQGADGKYMVLAIIPFVAAYCDAVGRDFDLRIALIARFLWLKEGPFFQYESFVAGGRKYWWLVGLAANLGASLIACTLVFLVGCSPSVTGRTGGASTALMVSAVIGAVLVALVEVGYSQRLRNLRKCYLQPKKKSSDDPA